MDNTIFTTVSALTAVGGILGTGIGLYRLQRDRATTLDHASEDAQRVAPKCQGFVQTTSDMSRVVGTLGLSTLKGMVLYPMTPPFLLPFVLKNDIYKQAN